VTGSSLQQIDTSAKRLELLREIVPNLQRLAIMVNPTSPTSPLEIDEIQTAANLLGVQTSTFEVRRVADIAPAIDALKGGALAVYVVSEPMLTSNRARIAALALGAHLPTVSSFGEFVESGFLLSYGPNFPDLFRRAAEFVDKILRGTRPADIPVEQPTKFDLVVNMITAKAIGLTIPETFLVRATEVIE
jgi:putative ABC transport system substrate-binding protein